MMARIMTTTVRVPLSNGTMGELEVVYDHDTRLYRLTLRDVQGTVLTPPWEDLSHAEYARVIRSFYDRDLGAVAGAWPEGC